MTICIDGTVVRGELCLPLDLEIGSGITTVSGPNGAGKTTLLRLIAGLEALESGALTIDGHTLDRPESSTFVPTHERPIAMAFQDHRLLPHLTVIDNIAFPLRRHGAGREEARTRARPHGAAMGLEGLLERRPAQLSLGQRQRAGLARALATPATVLLLDEPLASIDESGRAAIRRHLRELDRAHVVWVTHDTVDATDDAGHISVDEAGVRQTRPDDRT